MMLMVVVVEKYRRNGNKELGNDTYGDWSHFESTVKRYDCGGGGVTGCGGDGVGIGDGGDSCGGGGDGGDNGDVTGGGEVEKYQIVESVIEVYLEPTVRPASKFHITILNQL